MSSSSLSEPLTPPPDALSDVEDQPDQQSASLLAQERPLDSRKASSASAPPLTTPQGRTSSDNDEVEELTTTTTTTTTAASARLAKVGKNFDGLTAHHNRLHQRHQSQSEEGHSDSEITGTSTTSHATLTRGSSTTYIASPTLPNLHEPTTVSTGPDSDAKESKHKGYQSASGSTEDGLEDSLAAPAAVAAVSGSSTSSDLTPGTPSSVEGGGVGVGGGVGEYQTILTTTTTTTTKRKRKVRRPTFMARTSRLDPEAMTKNQDPFRGFHTLFWIVMGAYGVITFHAEWMRVGKMFGGTLFSSFSQDAIILAFSDFCLVLSTFVAFGLAKMVAKGWMPYQPVGFVLQHCIQVVFLISAVAWTIWR
ncbi:hypothetical protein DFQ27_003347 [Actinomortierella ambigua]|uniref:Uncharacterized protein n=1 Tax=Actinomortierella ambigua TaxID=1343610 RepID=A0A9P6Q8C8_9FUNG|nr:hypothetical protein DFQ27_003347 [Actinomortierella ambigua]